MQTIFNKDVRKKFYLQKFYLNTQKNFIQMISEFCCNIIFFTFSSNHLHKKYLWSAFMLLVLRHYPCFRPGRLSEILAIANLWHATSRISHTSQPSLAFAMVLAASLHWCRLFLKTLGSKCLSFIQFSTGLKDIQGWFWKKMFLNNFKLFRTVKYHRSLMYLYDRALKLLCTLLW